MGAGNETKKAGDGNSVSARLSDVFNRHRLAIAAGLFLTVESVLIIFFWTSAYGDPDPNLYADPDGMSAGVWFILSLVGYLLLGLIGRSWWTLLIALLPILIAIPIPYPTTPDPAGGEALPLWFSWLFGMVQYLPVCAIGVGVSKLFDRRRRMRVLRESNQAS